MSEPNTPSPLILPCKDCHQPVRDSETNAYRLIAGILYGWCDECFNRQQRFLKFGASGPDPVPVGANLLYTSPQST